jgi:hypothetical protein
VLPSLARAQPRRYQVQFVWVRLARTDDGGDSKRVKFVLLSWLGEAAGAMAKAKLTEHKAALQAVFQARSPRF